MSKRDFGIQSAHVASHVTMRLFVAFGCRKATMPTLGRDVVMHTSREHWQQCHCFWAQYLPFFLQNRPSKNILCVYNFVFILFYLFDSHAWQLCNTIRLFNVDQQRVHKKPKSAGARQWSENVRLLIVCNKIYHSSTGTSRPRCGRSAAYARCMPSASRHVG